MLDNGNMFHENIRVFVEEQLGHRDYHWFYFFQTVRRARKEEEIPVRNGCIYHGWATDGNLIFSTTKVMI